MVFVQTAPFNATAMAAAFKALVKQEENLVKDLQSRKLAEEEAERARKIRVSFSGKMFLVITPLLTKFFFW